MNHQESNINTYIQLDSSLREESMYDLRKRRSALRSRVEGQKRKKPPNNTVFDSVVGVDAYGISGKVFRLVLKLIPYQA
jgi:hypothetical protein